jgi:hypothetical protein
VAYTGTDFWADTTVDVPYFGLGTWRVVHLFIVVGFFCEKPNVIYFFLRNIRTDWNTEHMKQRFVSLHFVMHLLFMPTLILVWFLYMSTTPGTLTATSLFPHLYFAFGAQFLQSVHRMMVSDATSQRYFPFRRSQILCWLLLALNAY